jgi:hypothetical protein
MDIKVRKHRKHHFIVSLSQKELIKTPQDIMALLVTGAQNETNLFILNEKNFSAAFYDLKTGIAREVMQKFAEYHLKAAIVGNFKKITHGKFREFIEETNKGSQVYFTDDEDDAVTWLTSK